MNSHVDVSFITINYNSSECTIELVDSIVKNSKNISYEIIIVDNASQHEDFINLKTFVDTIEGTLLIRNRINSGFSAGNMLGLNYASGKYYFFINNDCVLLNNTAEILKNFLDENLDVAVSTTTILDKNGNYIRSYGQFPYAIRQLFGNSIHSLFSKQKFPSNKVNPTKPTMVDIISGASMFFRAEDICNIGGFDTMFFLYCEEEDICKRVWDYGKKVYYLPEAKIYHKEGASTEKSFRLKREFYISYCLLIEKHYNFFGSFMLKTALFMKCLRRVFKYKDGLAIFLAMIKGFSQKYSIRYKQSIVK